MIIRKFKTSDVLYDDLPETLATPGKLVVVEAHSRLSFYRPDIDKQIDHILDQIDNPDAFVKFVAQSQLEDNNVACIYAITEISDDEFLKFMLKVYE